MARKTFISYKYSDARDVRDRIINALGDDARYYRGEDGFSECLDGLKAETIKERLKDMIYATSVTIVVLSPEMLASKWIPWEIEYSLREYRRGDSCSHTNGVVAVIKKLNGDYSWIKTNNLQDDGCWTHNFIGSRMPSIVSDNRCNQNPKEYACEKCGSINWLTGSYISIIEEDDFLANPTKYIENAYKKSQNIWNYDLCKTR